MKTDRQHGYFLQDRESYQRFKFARKNKNRRYAYESERETIALVDKCAKKELL